AIAYHHYKLNLNAGKLRFLERNRWKTLTKNMPPRYFLMCGPLLALAEVGLTLRLASLGLLHSKARATLEFVHDLPDTIRERRRLRETGLARGISLELLTDEFPQNLPLTEPATLLSRKLMKGYYKAFIRGVARNRTPEGT